MNFIKFILENELGSVETNYKFSELTTVKVGGLIKFLYTPNNINSLSEAFKYINKNNITYFILGNGSNVLASDDFFDGVVINMKKMGKYLKVYDGYINVSSSYMLNDLVYQLRDLKLGDLSFLIGIPGTLGGAIYNNSGAFCKSIGDSILEVDYMNQLGEIITLTKNDLDFKYRHSIFHHLEGIIISAKINTYNLDTENNIKEYKLIRQNNQPSGYSLGSIFKNKPNIKAWEVIDLLGLRDFYYNGVRISDKHTNFIINENNATANDIIFIIELIKKRAFLELGIELETEIVIL